MIPPKVTVTCQLGDTARTIRLATEDVWISVACVCWPAWLSHFLLFPSPCLLYPFAGVDQPIIHGQHLQAIRLCFSRESTSNAFIDSRCSYRIARLVTAVAPIVAVSYTHLTLPTIYSV